MEFINDAINTVIEYLNMALEYAGIQISGSFDYNKIVEAIMGLFA